MTQRWLHDIKRTVDFTPEHDINVQVVAQDLADPPLVINHEDVAVTISDLNLGFARGMNLAIKVNNDCTFPDTSWLRNLLAEANGQALVPLNTKCNTGSIVAGEAGDAPPFTMPFVPAVCWAVPMEWILKIYMRYGYYLFDPAFHIGWCEDNYAAWIFRKLFDPDPFRIVPKAWIQHKGSVTVNDQIRQRGVGFTKDNEALYRRKTSEQ
jgi:hypothetical protein